MSETPCTFSSGALVSVASGQTRQFSIIDNVRLNWTEAQVHCRHFFTDLATIENPADTSLILNISTSAGRFFTIGHWTQLEIYMVEWNLNNHFTCFKIFKGWLFVFIAVEAWIGLHDDLNNSWRWSLNDSAFYDDGDTEFRNWYSDQPNNIGGQEHCVVLLSKDSGTWHDAPCSNKYLSVCYNGTLTCKIGFTNWNYNV